MIDKDGFRANIGIVVANDRGKLLWCRRVGHEEAWQFPQGGMNFRESLRGALFRELEEELGLKEEDVEIIHQIRHWIYYRLPQKYVRHDSKPLCIGQKQKWFLLRLVSDESAIELDKANHPEFVAWKWVDFWHPPEHIIKFKQHVYREVLKHFYSFMPKDA